MRNRFCQQFLFWEWEQEQEGVKLYINTRKIPTKFELYEKKYGTLWVFKIKIKFLYIILKKLVHHVLVFLVCNSFFFLIGFFFFLVVVNINILPCKQAKQRNKVDLMSMNFLFFHWQSHFYIKVFILKPKPIHGL